MRTSVVIATLLASFIATFTVKSAHADNKITGLTDFYFQDFWTGDSALDISVCVETDNANDYQLRLSSADRTRRAFEHRTGTYTEAWTMPNIDDSIGAIPFFIYIDEGSTAGNGTKIDNGDSTQTLTNASSTALCSGIGNNINIQVWLSQFRWAGTPDTTPGRYESTIDIELLGPNAKNGKYETLAQYQFVIGVTWAKEHLIQVNGDIFLTNQLNYPVTHTDLCIGLNGTRGPDPQLGNSGSFEGQNRSSYRLEITSTNAQASDSSFRLKQGTDTLAYRLFWRSNSIDQEYTPNNNSHILEVDNARAALNYSSLKQSGGCADTSGSEALIVELTELASSSGVYSDTLTLMISAE